MARNKRRTPKYPGATPKRADRREFRHIDGGVVKHYYDPGKNPRPRAVPAQATATRRGRERGA